MSLAPPSAQRRSLSLKKMKQHKQPAAPLRLLALPVPPSELCPMLDRSAKSPTPVPLTLVPQGPQVQCTLFPQKESPPCCILCGRMRQDGSGGSEGFWAAAGGETPSITSTSLVSNLPRLEVEKLKKDDWTANLGLLNIILSFLFMKGNDAKESPGWELLRRPRVDPGMRHEVFGDVNKLVTEESLRQKYLEYNRIPHTDPSKFEFQMQILGFVAKIQNKDLTAWSTKYTELAAEEAALGLPSTPETFSVARDLIVLTKLRALKLLVPPVQTVPPKGKPSVLHPLWQNETGRLRWIRRFLGCSWWRDSKHHIYILVSNLPRLEVENLKKDDWTANLGLLNVIISFLFMKGNDDKESPVWELLRRPRVDPGVRHEVFGDVNKLVTEESLRQKYLEYNRGARAAKETSKMQILGFVAKIQNKDPTAWSRPQVATDARWERATWTL
uniref:MAGE domain-containing protein n=1 Tax=Gopherus evgoodei TaxID=1825980 RepID=A0A8C4YJV0_9SAUR